MRKVFALLTLAGLLSVASCGGASTEGTVDSTAADTVATLAPADTTPVVADTTVKDTAAVVK